MNLKYQEVSWQAEKGLMYVRFDNNGQTLRWYPKWKDLVELFDSAWATEATINKGELSAYFLFACLKILSRSLLIEAKAPLQEIDKFNRLTTELQERLLK